MAYRNSTFYPVGNQSGRDHAPAKYIYRTDDTLAVITATDYFSDIKSRLSMGDEIEVQFVTFTSATDDTATEIQGKAKLVVAYKGNDLMHIIRLKDTEYALFGTMTDLSTAGGALGAAATDGNVDVVSSVAGVVTSYVTILGGAITVADAVLSSGNDTQSQAFTGGALTVANAGSAKGDVDTSSAVTLNGAVAAGETVRLISTGASTGVQELYCMIIVTEA